MFSWLSSTISWWLLGCSFNKDKYWNWILHLQDSLNSQEGRQRLVDPVVMANSSLESLSIVISIANKCICSESWSRPSFEDILWNLQYAAQVQETADNEQRFWIRFTLIGCSCLEQLQNFSFHPCNPGNISLLDSWFYTEMNLCFVITVPQIG